MYPQRSVMTCGLATALEPPHFNHAPVRGAIGASFSRRSRAGSFNPRTRVGCDANGARWCRKVRSFNPRTRVGCDSTAFLSLLKNNCFNPRTRVGCDLRFLFLVPLMLCFNPRTRVGCDYDGASVAEGTGYVSIHAPAWGATALVSLALLIHRRFNPRTRVGCDRPWSHWLC